MGDLEVCSPQPNGVFKEDHPFMSLSSSSSPPSSSSSSSSSSPPPPLPSSNPDPSSIGVECWATAEQTTHEIVCRIRPTLVSEQKRKEVIDYVQSLIRCSLGCQVFPYGSVPLKTYLPDGDIDLTALSSPDVEEALAYDVCTVLKGEEQNEDALYEVKDVQYIGGAEVKLVKCLVQNIVVDISFNQLGGLCTLCFLEQVDCLVGKGHLFKRSIILIKAWCYYESRILGAHHGLISTYALETLVLYIFRVFHSSLNDPLAVLYRFLDYFSKFDWENYYISLKGPVCKSSLPDIVAEVPENVVDDLLLSEEFLKSWTDMVSVPVRGLETSPRAFPQKHLNIIDPLKENNNLGRSVNRGNFYRIRSAFRYGARKLGRVLLLPRERIADELHKFFANTLERHISKYKADAQNAVLTSSAKGSGWSSPTSCTSTCSEDTVSFCSGKISGTEDEIALGIRNGPESSSMGMFSPQTVVEMECPAAGNSVSECHFAEDAKELPSSGCYHAVPGHTSDCLPSSSSLSTLQEKSHHAHNFHTSVMFTGNGKIENGSLCRKLLENCVIDDEAGSFVQPEPKENHLVPSNSVCSDSLAIPKSTVSNISENLSHICRKRVVTGDGGHSEILKSFVDLSGDYESHIRSLQYGQFCHGYTLPAPILPSPPHSPSKLFNKNPWDTVRRFLQFNQNFCPQMNTNGVVLGQSFFHLNNPVVFGSAFGSEEKQKPRGTGTYFPKMNYHSYRDKPTSGRGRNPTAGTNGHLQRHARNNGLASDPPETNSSEEGSREFPQAQYAVLGHAKSRSSDCHQSHPSVRGSCQASGISVPSETLEFGSFRPLPSGVPLSEGSSQLDSGSPHARGSTPGIVPSAMQDARPPLGNSQERIAGQSYHLKDDNDFPPLSL